MNIFSNIIITTNQALKEILEERLELDFLDEYKWIEILQNTSWEIKKVMIYSPLKNIEDVIEYITSNLQPIKITNIEKSSSMDSLDLKDGDVVIPNTFINSKNESIFSEYIVDNNYDFNKFWLVLNWICLTYKLNQEDDLIDIKKNYTCDIIDEYWYNLAFLLNKNSLLEKTLFIRVIWDEIEYYKNWCDILELGL